MAAGLGDEGKVEGGGGGGWRDTERMKEKQRERRCKNKKRSRGFFSFGFFCPQKPDQSVVSRGFAWTESTVALLHVTCTNNDGMMSHRQNWGVVFKVAEKMRDAGVRPLPPHLPHSPHHPLLHSLI